MTKDEWIKRMADKAAEIAFESAKRHALKLSMPFPMGTPDGLSEKLKATVDPVLELLPDQRGDMTEWAAEFVSACTVAGVEYVNELAKTAKEN